MKRVHFCQSIMMYLDKIVARYLMCRVLWRRYWKTLL